MNRLEFSYFEVKICKETMNSMEQKTRVFCEIYVQEFHLWICLYGGGYGGAFAIMYLPRI
jgi:hypothetical protein